MEIYSLLINPWSFPKLANVGLPLNNPQPLKPPHLECGCTYLQLLFNTMCRSLRLMNKCRSSLELFFAIWFVMGNVWIVDSRFDSFQRAPKLHLLCVFLLVWNAICYSFPFILFLLLCCCVPLISSLLGYNINMASTDKGASDDQISELPCWRYKASSKQPDSNNKGLPKEDPVSEAYNIYLQWRIWLSLFVFLCCSCRNVAFA